MLLTAVLALLVLIGLGLPVAAALAILGLLLAVIYSSAPLHLALPDIVWGNSTEFLLVAIPMFVFMGEILLRAGVARRMYESLTRWIGWLPGGLMHSNIGACALFAATSGSSVATAATVGTVAVPEIEKRGYNERLFLGTLTSGGTLGILIPPSINLIIFGLLTNTSVSALYLAGFLPGLLLAGIFSLTVIALCVLRPSWGGQPVRYSWRDRLDSLAGLLPPLLIFLVVVGSIYAGLATPTEAAALGVVISLLLATATRQLNVEMLRQAVEGTMRTTAMVMLIIVAAMFLNFVLGIIGLTQTLTTFIADLGWTPLQTLAAIIVFYLVLGCFLETLSMLITTTPLIAPIVVALGYDPVWFGIVLMVLLEMALLTPPIGINLYVVQSVRGAGRLKDVVYGTMPFLATMLVMVVVLIAWPEIALWLPGQFD
ncbi:TRAP transporter large permease [Pacificispira sp.]|uniref:TRAP transporter large permease n=1 Tax=Pacificispira sp. TaxID=2888761 RepID=UPI003BAC5FF9